MGAKLARDGARTIPPYPATLELQARPRCLAAQRVQQIARELQIQLSQGSTFLPQGEACDWLRLNVAYTQDHRAQVFFQRVEQESIVAGQ